MPNEIWKNIPGYPNYEASNLGRIKTNNTNPPKIRKIQLAKNGYQQIKLSQNNHNSLLRVHRVVAQTFIPNPDNLKEIDHIDGDKQNNSITNLRWCSRHTNLKHVYELNPNVQKYKMKTILGQNKQIIIFFPSLFSAGKYVASHISHHTVMAAVSTINAIIDNQYKLAYGFKWEKT